MPRRKGSTIPPKGRQLEALKAHHWKPGAPSPNPGGRPRAHREAVAKVRAEMDMITEGMLAIARRHANGETLSHSDKIASNHYEFLVQFAYGRHAQSHGSCRRPRRWRRSDRSPAPARTRFQRFSARYSRPIASAASRPRRRRRPRPTRGSPRKSGQSIRLPSCWRKSAPTKKMDRPRTRATF